MQHCESYQQGSDYHSLLHASCHCCADLAKRLFFWILLLLPVFCVIELASYISVKESVPTRILYRAELSRRIQPGTPDYSQNRPKFVQAAAPARESSGLLLFHPILGWDYPPELVHADAQAVVYTHGKMGERRTCTNFDSTMIATYGDSFTYCAEAGDEDTWQTHLARKLGTNVLNFGVGGYGTDQALLKYENNGQYATKIVLLCIFPENINRVVNIYRPFYTYHDPLKLTKPRFMADAQGITLVPNPVTSIAELSKLDQDSFLQALGKLDYWYQLDRNLPRFRFPYSLAFFEWSESVFSQLSSRVSWLAEYHQPHVWDLFNQAGPLSIMCYIADRFVAIAKERGEEPIIVLMPHKDYVNELKDCKISRMAQFIQYLDRRNYHCIDAIRCMWEMNPNQEQLEAWYGGHATPAGNKIVAEILNREIGHHLQIGALTDAHRP
ncbi:SGNH/GDSL hydrolase family protein [Desulfomonile tiedjei]|uniref:SGNH/GDSL hydrolase family protein n=1 Tax=Desulfomonile tiedjei (strain ATCC 49306 / DSM 6799 / DCB-1) TaxID=706587 RepID=I4CD11_DESTA|nr:SGNH/GDSL hydrolase family protein [Desulfomonile tiedjei]AFM27452.1 hypothetical protein Desti_4837 [Desulfomonile tiedjei DSM 6799]